MREKLNTKRREKGGRFRVAVGISPALAAGLDHFHAGWGERSKCLQRPTRPGLFQCTREPGWERKAGPHGLFLVMLVTHTESIYVPTYVCMHMYNYGWRASSGWVH